MALNEGIWGPKPKVTNMKGTNLKSWILANPEPLTNPPKYGTSEYFCRFPHVVLGRVLFGGGVRFLDPLRGL